MAIRGPAHVLSLPPAPLEDKKSQSAAPGRVAPAPPLNLERLKLVEVVTVQLGDLARIVVDYVPREPTCAEYAIAALRLACPDGCDADEEGEPAPDDSAALEIDAALASAQHAFAAACSSAAPWSRDSKLEAALDAVSSLAPRILEKIENSQGMLAIVLAAAGRAPIEPGGLGWEDAVALHCDFVLTDGEDTCVMADESDHEACMAALKEIASCAKGKREHGVEGAEAALIKVIDAKTPALLAVNLGRGPLDESEGAPFTYQGLLQSFVPRLNVEGCAQAACLAAAYASDLELPARSLALLAHELVAARSNAADSVEGPQLARLREALATLQKAMRVDLPDEWRGLRLAVENVRSRSARGIVFALNSAADAIRLGSEPERSPALEWVYLQPAINDLSKVLVLRLGERSAPIVDCLRRIPARAKESRIEAPSEPLKDFIYHAAETLKSELATLIPHAELLCTTLRAALLTEDVSLTIGILDDLIEAIEHARTLRAEQPSDSKGASECNDSDDADSVAQPREKVARPTDFDVVQESDPGFQQAFGAEFVPEGPAHGLVSPSVSAPRSSHP